MAKEALSRREERRSRPRLFERLLDPERERPFLKMLWQTLGPILMDFLTTKLPMMLVDQRPEKEDETEVA